MKKKEQTLDFRDLKIYVGIDTHKLSWKVTILTESISHKTFSQPPDPEILYNYLIRNFPGAIYYSAYEASYCGFWIHNRLVELGINNIIVNPGDIPTTNKERVQKEDKRDSRKIANCLRNGELHPIFIPPVKTLEDRNLVRARVTLSRDIGRIKNRIRSFLFFHGIKVPDAFYGSGKYWSNKFIEWLENIEFTEISGKESLHLLLSECRFLRALHSKTLLSIRKLSKTADYEENIKLLLTVPGIGLVTAMLIMTEISSIDRFNNFDKLCSYVGLIPSMNSSGEKKIDGEITTRRHKLLRCALIESSWVAAKMDPALNLCYNNLCKKMKANKAIIRISKKLLNRIRYVLINRKIYVNSVVQ